MDAMKFWRDNGSEVVKKVCEHANTSFAYYKHIAHRRKRPSVDLAAALISGSAIYGKTPMTMADLVKPRTRKKTRDLMKREAS